jgi:hypothetical protein
MSPVKMFRRLSLEERRDFVRWAHENYRPGSEISTLWHPVVQAECAAINRALLVERDDGSES